jgi:OOP family OmpA-OmpF porin
MKERLDELARCIKDRKSGNYVVGGHTDNQGNSIDNLLLSVDRARAATNYLVEQGVKRQRLEYRGFGDTQPIADNWTAQGRARNRRIEIRPR